MAQSSNAKQRRSTKDRSNDQLINLERTSEITTISVPTLRYLRHKGECPPLFRLGRRLVAWESEVYAWIEQQAALDANANS